MLLEFYILLVQKTCKDLSLNIYIKLNTFNPYYSKLKKLKKKISELFMFI